MSVMARAERLKGLDAPTVWAEFTPLAREAGAINLGQGFPDWSPPPIVLDALAAAAITTGDSLAHQYCRSEGHPTLVGCVLLRRFWISVHKVVLQSSCAPVRGTAWARY